MSLRISANLAPLQSPNSAIFFVDLLGCAHVGRWTWRPRCVVCPAFAVALLAAALFATFFAALLVLPGPVARYSCRQRFMFVIELSYTGDLKDIDSRMKAHVAFLKKHYAAGTFVMSGRKIPRTGGIILATGKTRHEIEAIMSDDPFCREGLADVRVIEFRASQRADDIPERLA